MTNSIYTLKLMSKASIELSAKEIAYIMSHFGIYKPEIEGNQYACMADLAARFEHVHKVLGE